RVVEVRHGPECALALLIDLRRQLALPRLERVDARLQRGELVGRAVLDRDGLLRRRGLALLLDALQSSSDHVLTDVGGKLSGLRAHATVDSDTGDGRVAGPQRPRFAPLRALPARRVVFEAPFAFLAAGLRVFADRVGAGFGRSMPRASSARLR